MPARGEQVEQHAEGIDVGGGSDRLALHLLRGGELRRERAASVQGERGALPRSLLVQQLRDAEVQQLHDAVAGDQDVGRLDVAVDDQIRVRVLDGAHDLKKERDAAGEGEGALGGEDVDAQAVDVLQDQVRLPRLADTGVEQPGDVGMGQPGERGSLPAEALPAEVAQQREVEELHRGGPLEPAVGAPCEPHGPHPALSQRALDGVGAELEAGETDVRLAEEEPAAVRVGLSGEEGGQLRSEPR